MTYPYTIPIAILAAILLHRLLVAMVSWTTMLTLPE